MSFWAQPTAESAFARACGVDNPALIPSRIVLHANIPRYIACVLVSGVLTFCAISL